MGLLLNGKGVLEFTMGLVIWVGSEVEGGMRLGQKTKRGRGSTVGQNPTIRAKHHSTPQPRLDPTTFQWKQERGQMKTVSVISPLIMHEKAFRLQFSSMSHNSSDGLFQLGPDHRLISNCFVCPLTSQVYSLSLPWKIIPEYARTNAIHFVQV